MALDFENLCGGPSASAAEAVTTWLRLRDTLGLTASNCKVIIGLSAYSAAKWMDCLPLSQVRLVIGNGPDGADLALLDAIDPAWEAARCDDFIMVSGDHIFADLMQSFRALGKPVCSVVSNHALSSWQVQQACDEQVVLDDSSTPLPDSADQLSLQRPARHKFLGELDWLRLAELAA